MIIKIDSDRAASYAIKTINGLSYDPPMQITIEPETRKLYQNNQQWPILNAIADQVQWPINGMLQTITADDFKEILTVGWRNEQVRVAQGVDGGVVLLGHRTSKFNEKEWPEWMEYLNWFASEKGVKIPISKSQEREYML
jgi:hypothetical protein